VKGGGVERHTTQRTSPLSVLLRVTGVELNAAICVFEEQNFKKYLLTILVVQIEQSISSMCVCVCVMTRTFEVDEL